MLEYGFLAGGRLGDFWDVIKRALEGLWHSVADNPVVLGGVVVAVLALFLLRRRR